MRVSDMAEREIAALAERGIVPTFREAVWLNELGLAVEEPRGETSPALAPLAVRSGNAVFRERTLASGHFLATWLDHYATHSGRVALIGFALAHGQKPEVLEALLTLGDVRRAVNAWALRCSATLEQVESVIRRLLPELQDPHRLPCDQPDKDDDGDLLQCLADLEVASGQSAAAWMARPDSDVVRGLRAVARSRAMFGAAAGDDEYRRASLRFMEAVEAIEAAHAKDAKATA